MTAVAQNEGLTLREADRVANFRIEKVLGAGSFGVTYVAHDETLNRRVAIKEYMPDAYAKRDSTGQVSSRNAETAGTFEWGLERFSEEARTLAQFSHNNIVRVLTIVPGVNGTSYIVMELLGGTNLESVVEKEGPIATDRFLAIFRQILDGMRAVHQLGILHRDIKPANIVLEERGPVLIDFGAARELAMQKKAGFSALVTDGFSPPEQYSSKNIQDQASDIYALATTAHYLLSGEVPPPAAARHAGEDLAPASTVRPDLPSDVAAAIDHGLQLKMADRPQTIGAWLDEMPSLTAKPELEKEVVTEVVYVDHGKTMLDRRGLLLLGAGVAVAGGAAALLIGRDNSVSASAQPLGAKWKRTIAPLSGEPFPGMAVGNDRVFVAAHAVGEDGNDHALLAAYAADGVEAGRWVHDAPGTRAHAVLALPDGAVLVGGETPTSALVAKLDANLRPVWVRTYDAGSISSVMKLRDEIVAGMEGPESSGQAKLMFLGADGGVLNEIVLLDRRGDSVQCIAPLEDGAIAVLGSRLERRIVDGQGQDVAGLWLARVAPSGEEVWRLAESGMGFANGFEVIEAGGNLFVSGKTSPDGDPAHYRTMLMRVSKEGRKLWSRWDYDKAPSSWRGLARSLDGTPALYVAGWQGSPPTAQAAQVGPDGDLVWRTPVHKPTGGGDIAAALATGPAGRTFAVGIDVSENDTLSLTVSRLA